MLNGEVEGVGAFSAFAKNWLGSKGLMPQTAHKLMRLGEHDIPEMYQDSPLRYLLSIPAVGGK